MFNKLFYSLFGLILILSVILSCFFIPNVSNSTPIINYTFFELNSNIFLWPTPGYSVITSYFGSRKSPITGASSYHSGIDIGAPTGSNIVAICSGKITYTGFNGAGGYSIILKNDNFTISYCHVSPNYIVHVGQFVSKGSIIGNVGPKNVYGVPNNPYKDSKGNSTNGATTGPHLHFGIKKDGTAVNPLNYY